MFGRLQSNNLLLGKSEKLKKVAKPAREIQLEAHGKCSKGRMEATKNEGTGNCSYSQPLCSKPLTCFEIDRNSHSPLLTLSVLYPISFAMRSAQSLQASSSSPEQQ